MKKVYLSFLFICMFLLASCSQTVEDIEKKDDQKEVIETKEEDAVIDNECASQESVNLEKTDTLSGLDLWNNSLTCDNLTMTDNQIYQTDPSENGVLVSGDFFIDSFDELVPSWNVINNEDSKVTILLAVGNEEGYSMYYAMGMWMNDKKSSYSNQEDDYARVSVDTVIAKKDTIDRIKFRIVFARGEQSSILKNVSITTARSTDPTLYDTSVLSNKEISVSPRQQLSIPTIGNVICSPTSLSMVLNYYGHSEAANVVAASVYDSSSSMYGNWSFNASYAGGFDHLYSRVEYTKDLSDLMTYIDKDIPLVLSIKTSSKESLEGSIMAYPSGHLVVLIGFKEENGQWYAIINDPAEYDDSLVRREYKIEELLEAWRGYMYVVQDESFN